MANTLVGSVMAMVSVAPTRLSGMIWYFCAVSRGMSLTMAGSMSNCVRLIDGTPYCLLNRPVMSSSRTKPSFTSAVPSLPPWPFW
jgi:hypothetical protein